MSERERLIWTIHDSPVGPLTLVAGPEGIRNIHFPGRTAPPAGAARGPLPALADQLDAYFAGQLRAFDVDLDVRGNRLQLLVWRRLLEIPYGATTTYGELARRIDGDAYPEGLEPYERARVVGAALGRNPVPVVVPCHRVIGRRLAGRVRGWAGAEAEVAGAGGSRPGGAGSPADRRQRAARIAVSADRRLARVRLPGAPRSRSRSRSRAGPGSPLPGAQSRMPGRTRGAGE